MPVKDSKLLLHVGIASRLTYLGSAYFHNGGLFTTQFGPAPDLLIPARKFFDNDKIQRRSVCNSLTEQGLTVTTNKQDSTQPLLLDDRYRAYDYRIMTLCPLVYSGQALVPLATLKKRIVNGFYMRMVEGAAGVILHENFHMFNDSKSVSATPSNPR